MSNVVAPDDPHRCQGTMRNGQCTLEALPNESYCKLHIRQRAEITNQKNIRNLRVSIWQNRINEMADSPEIKSLREEIGVMRLILESLLNNCSNVSELIANSQRIENIVSKIEKIVASCHYIEKSSGQLLDKGAALQLAGGIIDIVARNCDDVEAVTRIADEIAALVSNSRTNMVPE